MFRTDIRLLENRLSSCCCPPCSAKFTPRTAHARGVFFLVRSGAVVSQDHSAVSVSTVRLGVQFRRLKAAGPPQELEVRCAKRSLTSSPENYQKPPTELINEGPSSDP
jgi:hypothetical protein